MASNNIKNVVDDLFDDDNNEVNIKINKKMLRNV